MIGLVAAALGAAATLAATGATPAIGTTDKAAIEKIVHDYILEHPEILPEAMDKLQERETTKAVAANRKAIETPYAGAWEGNPDGDVVLVEFFDYACGYCRASLPDIERLLKEDPKLKIVYREMPVLGPDSTAAAELSLRVAKTGRYAAFHRAAYAARPDAAARARLAQQFGVDPKAKDAAAEREIAANLQLQSALRLSGTPSWVVGDKLLAGAVGYDALKAAIAEVRAARK
ncbi:DsbA family protein [Sphingomonas sp. SUN039]|uniref:DsbA family protein n=1 Tax=Sphingomonas sp. SUN039 TaxID=2937787 RepID=UPI002164A503|nr:thioredoxin domain-containing protein [Sphingomonas sp. SUN039]UVO55644.1 thioredoxin domain-containing protein [Sphingomonas sp. SUN039]